LSPLLFDHRLERVLHLPDEVILHSRLLMSCLWHTVDIFGERFDNFQRVLQVVPAESSYLVG
jgi:hypothetical protein